MKNPCLVDRLRQKSSCFVHKGAFKTLLHANNIDDYLEGWKKNITRGRTRIVTLCHTDKHDKALTFKWSS